MKKNDLPNPVIFCLTVIWFLVVFVHFLHSSTIVGEIVSDIGSGEGTVSFNVVVGKDTTPPTIISTTISPYDPLVGEEVFLNMSATDDRTIDGKFVEIILPNETTVTLFLPADYTVQLGGRHEITFFANDTSGNVRTVEDYFIAGNLSINVTFNVVDSDFKGIPANLTIYLPGTNKKAHLHNFTGTKQDRYADISYDLDYSTYNGNFNLRLNGVDLLLNQNKTLGFDRVTNLTESDLVTYAVHNTYNFTDSTLTVSYAGTDYTNQDYLNLYKCADWNFTIRTCLGEWTVYTAIQDKTTKTFTFTTTSFSAFLIKQESVPTPQPPPTGGVGRGIIPTPKEEVPEVVEKEVPEEIPEEVIEEVVEEEIPVPVEEVPPPEEIIKEEKLLLEEVWQKIKGFYLRYWVCLGLLIILLTIIVILVYLLKKERKKHQKK